MKCCDVSLFAALCTYFLLFGLVHALYPAGSLNMCGIVSTISLIVLQVALLFTRELSAYLPPTRAQETTKMRRGKLILVC
jgi:hypothetical protein